MVKHIFLLNDKRVIRFFINYFVGSILCRKLSPHSYFACLSHIMRAIRFQSQIARIISLTLILLELVQNANR